MFRQLLASASSRQKFGFASSRALCLAARSSAPSALDLYFLAFSRVKMSAEGSRGQEEGAAPSQTLAPPAASADEGGDGASAALSQFPKAAQSP